MLTRIAWIVGTISALCLYTAPLGAEVGVTPKEIRLGQVCALSGPAQGLGQELKGWCDGLF